MKPAEKEKQLPEPKEDKQLARRLMLLFFIIFVIFAVLVLRLAYVQLVEGETYAMLSENNQLKRLPITAPRGRILDANGEVLVDNQTVFTVTFQPLEGSKKASQDVEAIAQRLAAVLEMDPEEVLEAMDVGPQQRMSSYIPRRIKSGITPQMMAYLEEHRSELPGVDIVPEPMRKYVYGRFLSHVLGYTRPVPADEKEKYLAKGYRADDRVGVFGLEQQYEDVLKGIDGYMEVVVNSLYERVGTQKVVPPVRGHDLVLTIEREFQMKVEQILQETVDKLAKEGVTQASAVVLDPKTGAVKAMANIPMFDPNLFNGKLTPEVYAKEIQGREQNIAISGSFTPGSVVKPATVLMGMHEGVITPTTRLPSGTIHIGGGRTVRDGGRVSGNITAKVALQRSSNVFMVGIGERIVKKYPGSYLEMFALFDKYYQMFGLGQKTGIDLPNESIGLRGRDKYYGSLLYMTFGQYHNYTPIQLAQYVATIANGGYRLQPYLVQEIRVGTDRPGELGEVIWRKTPKVLNRLPMDPAYIKDVQEGMRLVASPGGTGYYVYQGLPFQVAAKTGTAQTGAGDNSLILGYAPYEDPEIAFVVVIPKGGAGSAVSGPVSRKIIEAYFGLDQEKTASEQP
nr:hypothetical protein [Bacillota bacterium]